MAKIIRIYWKLESEPDSAYAFLTDINDSEELHHERLPNTTYKYKLVLLHPRFEENPPTWANWPVPLYATATTLGETLEGIYESIYSPIYE